MNVVLFSTKSVPWGLPVAGVKSFRFLIYLGVRLYGPTRFMQVASTVQPFVFDLLSPSKNRVVSGDPSLPQQPSNDVHPSSCKNDDVLQILLHEWHLRNNLPGTLILF
jgi:hypothetical protein